MIIHKLDRLARDMNVHTVTWKQLDDSRTALISCSEPLGNSAQEKFMRSIMAANATFYSDNLGDEVRKGLQQKVLLGGTPGYCKLGYLNEVKLIEGREVKKIILDPERAPHIEWAFKAFATGDWSISDITAELERRGLRNRTTASRPGKPLTRSQVHRTLSSPYYLGKVPFKGVIYNGLPTPR